MKILNTAGVVVCRFQVPQLHKGHLHLLNTVKKECGKILVAVGVSPGGASRNDPMDFKTRAVMLKSQFPDAIVVEIRDRSSDEAWSADLDRIIEDCFPNHEVTLFGSRDSFLPSYKGRHSQKYIHPEALVPTGTQLRKKISSQVIDSEEFRAGVIYAATKQSFPTSFQTVDVAIRHSLERKVLVGRKTGEANWRFPGGFVDPGDSNLEMSAKREIREEVGDIEIGNLKYLSSIRVDDYRYKKSAHKIMTALFSAIYVFGLIRAGDDLAEVKWQNFDTLLGCLVEEHKVLGEIFLQSIGN
ncbi:MAG: NUDIX hydrolase [Candidatus Magasanikbacteria bacterium GW2011_GWC2_40_17]|nr:MAG: NUDIX hydrolase [Candidatus Magasanikbacteria bacterium GW2011_GWC2_40_17]